MNKKFYLQVFIALLFTVSGLQAQTLLPKPEPPRAVNDFAGLLSASEVQSLENKLRTFTDTTSNAIVVVIVDDLKGYDISEFAFKIGNDWGVGQAGFKNGVVVLMKTKTAESGGRIFIAPGYGLEGAIPDLTCDDIIQKEILPKFREGDYYGGLDAGTDVLMALASGEYSYENYSKKAGAGKKAAAPAGFIIILIIIILIIASKSNSNNRNIGRRGTSGLPFWLLMSMMGGGGSHRGSWGGFSGGGGGFSGGGGGGFGGFGGGSFGGGGAGGSW